MFKFSENWEKIQSAPPLSLPKGKFAGLRVICYDGVGVTYGLLKTLGGKMNYYYTHMTHAHSRQICARLCVIITPDGHKFVCNAHQHKLFFPFPKNKNLTDQQIKWDSKSNMKFKPGITTRVLYYNKAN